MTQAVTLAQLGGADTTLPFRNRIINGAQVINQRYGTTSQTGASGFVTDRFQVLNSSAGTVNAQTVTTAPTGFTNSTQLTVGTADASVGSTDSVIFYQTLEGYSTADFDWGTANAKTVTLSFWVRSSLTGTFSGSLVDQAGNYSFPFNYTINSANTWEFETITIAGDTTGTWQTTTSTGISVLFSLAAGSSLVGTANAWTGVAAYQGATGQTNILATNAATWYVTGVQLEKGNQATPFDFRSYISELQYCQRYFEKSFSINTAVANGVGQSTTDGCMLTLFNSYDTSNGFFAQVTFQVSKRTSPTITYYRGGGGVTDGVWATYDGSWTSLTSMATTTTNTSSFQTTGNRTGAFTTKTAYIGTGNWTASAEL